MIKSFNRQRKIVSLLLALTMILTALPLAGFTAFAEDELHKSEGFEYRILEDGSAEITSYIKNAETYDIPSELDGHTVTSIGDYSFTYCDSLKNVIMPDSVTNIGVWAFAHCPGLADITIPDKVTSIGNYAFSHCSGLTDVIIPESVTDIGYAAFEWCENLASVTIGDSVTSIGNYAFSYCSNLTSITIPDSVTDLGDYAFAQCTGLTSVTIGDGVTSIGDWAFENCGSLTEINVGANNNYYSSQEGVLFDKNITELILYPVGNKRTSYDIPNGVTSIGGNIFSNCDSLKNVTIPESVEYIHDFAFENCNGLTEIKVDANNKNYASQDGVLFNKNKTELIQYPVGNERKTYEIPDSVTLICENSFKNCNSLTDIYILNKDCFIVSSEYSYPIPTKTTIHGYTGSTAEEYAKEYGNNFVVIEDEPVPPDDPTKPDKPVTPDEPNAIGDVDGNKSITITDAKWILQNTVKSRNLTEAQAKAADLNKDGKVTIVDAKWVLQIVVGLRDAQTLKPIKK